MGLAGRMEAVVVIENLEASHMADANIEQGIRWALPVTVEPSGWEFPQITLRFDNTTGVGTFGSLKVSLYDDSGGFPGFEQKMLSGTSPTDAGDYLFTVTPPYSFEGETTYWIVLTVETDPMVTYYAHMAFDSSMTTLPGWSMGEAMKKVENGDWPGTGISFLAKVEAIPEPGTLLLLVPGGGGFLLPACRRKGIFRPRVR